MLRRTQAHLLPLSLAEGVPNLHPGSARQENTRRRGRTLTSFDLRLGDCRTVLAGIEAESIDAAVTDSPYHLSSKPGGSKGFMGKEWDGGGVAFEVATWRAVYRVLKPGAHLLAFGGTRTYHRMTCAIEDAGFEIRDCLTWNYANGFPKSTDVSKAIDRAAGVKREVLGHTSTARPNRVGKSSNAFGTATIGGEITEPATEAARRWEGWGSALKPAHEPIVLARKPFRGTLAANVQRYGTGGLNIDASRVITTRNTPGVDKFQHSYSGAMVSERSNGRWPPNFLLSHSPECERTGERTVKGDNRDPSGRRPGGFAGVGSDSGDGGPNGTLHGDEVVPTWRCVPGCPVAELDRQSGESESVLRPPMENELAESPGWRMHKRTRGHQDAGGASRFFPCFEWEDSDFFPFRYCPKAGSSERDAGLDSLPVASGGEATDRVDGSAGLESPRAGAGRRGGRRNLHPTVKPIALMSWLIRLITPPGGLVLDPFAGSGTTLIAATRGGFRALGIELSEEYHKMARLRIEEDSPLFLRGAK